MSVQLSVLHSVRHGTRRLISHQDLSYYRTILGYDKILLVLFALSHCPQQLKGLVALLDALLEVLQADRRGVVLLLHGCPHDPDIMLHVEHRLRQPTPPLMTFCSP